VNRWDYLGLDPNLTEAERLRKNSLERCRIIGNVDDFKISVSSLDIPFTNKQWLWISAVGDYKREYDYRNGRALLRICLAWKG
jgi:hypothetical protein